MTLKALVGSGDKIALLALPFVAVGSRAQRVAPVPLQCGWSAGYPAVGFGDHRDHRSGELGVVGGLDRDQSTEATADHERTVRGGQAPPVHRRFHARASVGRISARLMAGRRARACLLCRLPDVLAGRGEGAVADVWGELGRVPQSSGDTLAVKGRMRSVGSDIVAGLRYPGWSFLAGAFRFASLWAIRTAMSAGGSGPLSSSVPPDAGGVRLHPVVHLFDRQFRGGAPAEIG